MNVCMMYVMYQNLLNNTYLIWCLSIRRQSCFALNNKCLWTFWNFRSVVFVRGEGSDPD